MRGKALAHLAPGQPPMSENEFRLRVGRIRAKGTAGPRTFVGEALAAVQRAGGFPGRTGGRGSTFGRGRAASLSAQQGLAARSRGAVIKARVVRHSGRGAPLSVHLNYLQRDGVTQDGARGQVFDAAGEADPKAFAARCADDRHHFRFIVSPDDAEQLADLKAFTRDLMAQAETDLGTHLDWVAVDHWNTGHPHIHVLVRGAGDDGRDLVISRDYIAEGLRARAGQLVTLELGLRNDAELVRRLDQQVGADRWTPLDRSLARSVGEQDGLIDVRPPRLGRPDWTQPAKVARLKKLQGLGLAQEAAPGRWSMARDAEQTLRALGQREDIIARIHRALTAQGVARDPGRYALGEDASHILGRLVGRGLDDELKATAFAVVEGLDGRTHHVRLKDLEAASDAPLGAIVEAQARTWGKDRSQVVLAVRSDLSLAQQVTAEGATWLDRQLVGRAPAALGEGGFAEEVRAALAARSRVLAERGLARSAGPGTIFARDLLDTMRDRELGAAARRLSGETGLPHQSVAADGEIAGVYRQRVNLASGRFAMIDNGLGFVLVPWRPDLERHLGQEVRAVAQAGGGIAWSFTQKRGLGL